MASSTLQAPRPGGRSRFSKALPVPPSLMDDTQNPTASSSFARDLPVLPAIPTSMSLTSTFPPRTDSVGTRFQAKPLDSPLPALPPMLSAAKPPASPLPELPVRSEARKAPNSIPRKPILPPVQQPAQTQPIQPTQSGPTPLTLKRMSSISSLLSAYSHSSTDSIPRSSQGSEGTKASEPSLSPEREVLENERSVFNSKMVEGPVRKPNEEPSFAEKEIMESKLLPPPPMKDGNASFPTSPRVGLPATPRSTRPDNSPFPPPKDEAPRSTSPASSLAESPPRREIWRRRASSKSDRNIVVTGLKLAVSHGSTAESVGTFASAAPASLPVQNNAGDEAERTPAVPPKPGVSLPGRNIKPVSQQSGLEKKTSVPPRKPLASQNQREVSSAQSTRESPVPVTVTAPVPEQSAPAENKLNSRGGSLGNGMQKPLSVDKITAPAIISPMSLSEEVQQGFDNAAARRPAGNGQPDGNNGVKAKASMPNIETANAPSLSTVPVPRAPVALRPAPSLPVLRVEESTPTSERMKFGSNHNSNNSMALPAPPAGQYKDMEPVQLTPEDQQRIEAAYNLFPRGYMFEASPEGIWPALEISVNHKQCLSSHRAWIISKNLHYSLRCMVCHVADKNPRAVCKTCSLRVCTSCQKLVTKKKLEDVDVASLREANPIDTEGTEA